MDRSGLNFNHLRAFSAIAAEGSIVRASLKLHVTQPTLSAQLRALEEFLGTKLFHRRTRKLVLNEHGRAVQAFAQRIFTLSEELVLTVGRNRAREESLRILRIGVLPSLHRPFIQRTLFPLLDSADIFLNVREGSLPFLLHEVETENMDFIFSDSPAPPGRRFLSHAVSERNFVAVGGPGFRSLSRGFPRSLEGVRFAAFTPHSNLRSEIDHFFRSRKIRPAIVAEFDDDALLLALAEQGKCVTVLPRRGVESALLAGKLVELGLLTGIQSSVWAIFRKDHDEAAKRKLLHRMGIRLKAR